MNMKKVLCGLAIAAVVASSTQVASAQTKGFGPHLVGKKMPTFKLTDTKGKVYTNKSLKGKVVLIDFWATWCGPCKMASPAVQKLHDKYKDKGLVVIGADVMEQSPDDAKNGAARYAKEHKYTYNFTPKSDALAKTLGITSIPAFVFIDREGKIAATPMGYSPTIETFFEGIIKKLLAKD
jgi:thiol-disulfide isomerase/thioredoxin